MQIWYEDSYPNKTEVKEIIQKYFKNINPYLFNFYFEKLSIECNEYYGDWENFYYVNVYDIINTINKNLLEYKTRSSKILNNLILKKFMRDYINYCKYKPNGLEFDNIKEHFRMLVKNKINL